jgi:hypothetical protein
MGRTEGCIDDCGTVHTVWHLSAVRRGLAANTRIMRSISYFDARTLATPQSILKSILLPIDPGPQNWARTLVTLRKMAFFTFSGDLGTNDKSSYWKSWRDLSNDAKISQQGLAVLLIVHEMVIFNIFQFGWISLPIYRSHYIPMKGAKKFFHNIIEKEPSSNIL